jgi:hypothetical protein
MSSTFITISLIVMAVVLLIVIVKFFTKEIQPESNFIAGSGSLDNGSSYQIRPAPPEYETCQEKEFGIISNAIKRAPKTIMTLIIINIILGFAAGRISDNTADKLGLMISSFSQGEYGSAISALWSIGKPEVIEQTRITLGTHPDLEKMGLNDFKYVGTPFGKKLAIFSRLYSTQDHDKDLKDTDPDYGNVLKLSVSAAKKICKDKYNADLISLEEWQVVVNHTRASINIEKYSDIPEWTRNAHSEDGDDFLVIAKDSKVREHVKREGIDNEDEGLYVDGDDLLIAGFRCSITWDNDASENTTTEEE